MVHPNIHARAYRLGIFMGFSAFFMMEKTLRVLGSGEGHTHSPEGHGHRDRTSDESASSAIEPNSTISGLRSRHNVNGESSGKHECQLEEEKGHVNGPSKLSAYLNLFGDFVHNMSVVPEIVPSNTC
jgi:solute carrier family 39 (zinc transporter), member 7